MMSSSLTLPGWCKQWIKVGFQHDPFICYGLPSTNPYWYGHNCFNIYKYIFVNIDQYLYLYIFVFFYIYIYLFTVSVYIYIYVNIRWFTSEKRHHCNTAGTISVAWCVCWWAAEPMERGWQCSVDVADKLQWPARLNRRTPPETTGAGDQLPWW